MMFLEVERGSKVRYRNPSGPLRLQQLGLHRPTSLQWPVAACDFLFGEVADAEHLRHLPKHGNEGQTILHAFDVNPRSLAQVPNPIRNKAVALDGFIQQDFVVDQYEVQSTSHLFSYAVTMLETSSR
jgi:hypothetical protein